ncbi:MAG: hypothetical protein AB1779_10135, partial [Candidatus Thermoplasmatota archaeon]
MVIKYDGLRFTVLARNLGFDIYDAEWKPNGEYALIVGTNGKIVKYDGTAFAGVPSPTSNNLNKIGWKKDGAHALIAGDSGTILKYDGTTFTTINSQTTNNFNSVAWHPTDSYALFVGDGGDVFKYDGVNATKLGSGTSYALKDIDWKPDGSYALILGTNADPSVITRGVISKYDGTSFTLILTPFNVATGSTVNVDWKTDGTYALITFYNYDSNLAYRLYKYDGSTFTLIYYFTLPFGYTGPTLTGVSWKPNGDYALVVGHAGQVFKYDSACLTQLSTSYPTLNLYDVAWKPDGSYASITMREFILKYDGTKFTYQPIPLTWDYPCDGGYIDWKPDGSYALITGLDILGIPDYYRIIKYDGSAFNEIYATTTALRGISWKPDGSYAIVVGDAGTVLMYDGTAIKVLSSGITNNLYSVSWKPDSSYALIVGTGGKVIKYNGTTFTDLPSGVTSDLYSVNWTIDGSYALIVGSGGTALKYDGTNFTKLSSGTTYNLNKVRFNNKNEAIVVGDSGTIRTWNGTGFKSVASMVTNNLRGVSWYTGHNYHNYAIIVGDGGIAFELMVENLPNLNVLANANPVTIFSGGSTDIPVYVTESNQPVKDIDLTFTASSGSFDFNTGKTDKNGQYKAIFTAPPVTTQTYCRVNVKGNKTGYDNGYGFVDVIVNPQGTPTLYVSIAAKPSAVYPGYNSTIAVQVSDGSVAVSDVEVRFNEWYGGKFTPATGKTDKNGAFTTTFTAPSIVYEGFLARLTAVAVKSGYNLGLGYIDLGIILYGNLLVDVKATPPALNSGGSTKISVHVTNGTSALSDVSIKLSSDSGGVFNPKMGITNATGDFISIFDVPSVAVQTICRVTAQAFLTGYNIGIGYVDVVINPENTLIVTVNVSVSKLSSGATTIVKAYVSDGFAPIENAVVTFGSNHGGFSVEKGLTNLTGEYSTIFIAPIVSIDTIVRISASASKPLYNPGTDYIEIIVSPLPYLRLIVNISLSELIVESTKTSNFDIKVTDGKAPVSNVTLTLYSICGGLSPSNGTTDENGSFKGLFIAPSVEFETICRITAQAKKTDYLDGYGY